LGVDFRKSFRFILLSNFHTDLAVLGPKIRKATVLASSSERQVSNWYADQEHGWFTYYFLKAIQESERCDANQDNKLSFQEIYNLISSLIDGIPYKSKNLFSAAREQNPVLMGDAKDRELVNLGR
jgi:hypothetical protein